ncbi:hypothetical protein IW261DRAFT_1420027 [Armillaria novae-zelandiae]|uniref:Uncharacterized protein n=1 Tax=Armillaria novae-zelandiae TaxID=153914 RepID=A0AA39P8Y8_9AGAR|nr:hypothetical protein IW261DRAFT_1420027 [Armillaria novae-zelandiae]
MYSELGITYSKHWWTHHLYLVEGIYCSTLLTLFSNPSSIFFFHRNTTYMAKTTNPRTVSSTRPSVPFNSLEKEDSVVHAGRDRLVTGASLSSLCRIMSSLSLALSVVPDLQYQSESSGLVEFPQYTPSYGVIDNQATGDHFFGNSAGDFNQNPPTRHDPEVTNQLASHSYLHDHPQTPSMNSHLRINPSTYTCPPETHPGHAYFPQAGSMSYYGGSQPSDDLTHLCAKSNYYKTRIMLIPN